MNFNKLKETEYIKCMGLLAELIDLDADTKEKIYMCFKSMGIKNFFINLESISLSPEVFEKLNNIKSIIEIFDEKGGQA